MKRLIFPLVLALVLLCGCGNIVQQVETIAQQVDVEAIVTGVIKKIDLEHLQGYAKEDYDTLVKKYPALEEENIKTFLKENGLELMNKYVKSTDEEAQANAAKLGQIIVILYPDLADEVEAVLPQG